MSKEPEKADETRMMEQIEKLRLEVGTLDRRIYILGQAKRVLLAEGNREGAKNKLREERSVEKKKQGVLKILEVAEHMLVASKQAETLKETVSVLRDFKAVKLPDDTAGKLEKIMDDLGESSSSVSEIQDLFELSASNAREACGVDESDLDRELDEILGETALAESKTHATVPAISLPSAPERQLMAPVERETRSDRSSNRQLLFESSF